MHTKLASFKVAVLHKLAERPERVFPSIWMENDKGEKWEFPDHNYLDHQPPKEFTLQVSRFPRELKTTWLKITQPEEVAKCPHEHIQPTGGWVDGIEGRECKDCGGALGRRMGCTRLPRAHDGVRLLAWRPGPGHGPSVG